MVDGSAALPKRFSSGPRTLFISLSAFYRWANLYQQGLVANAESAANACRGTGDLATLGRCLSTYWEQKKRIAPGELDPFSHMRFFADRFVCCGILR